MVVRRTWASVPPDPQHHQARVVGEKKEEANSSHVGIRVLCKIRDQEKRALVVL